MPNNPSTIQRGSQRAAAMKAANGGALTYAAPEPTVTQMVQPASPQLSGPTPQTNLPVGGGSPQRGMFPNSLVNGADRNTNSPAFRGAGMRSPTFPFPPTTTASTVVSATTAAIQQVSSTLQILVNNQPTPVQDVLNFLNSPNAEFVYANGGIQVIVSQSGDGLDHGDSVWDADAAVAFWRDDFYFGQNSTASAGGASSVGEMKWDMVLGSGATALSIHAAIPHLGMIQISSGSTTTTNSCIFSPFGSNTSNPGGVFQGADAWLDYPGWKMTWVFGFQSQRTPATSSPFPLAKKQMYVGLAPSANDGSTFWVPNGSNGRPSYFVGMRFDTDTTSPAISDSTFKFEVVANPDVSNTRNNTQGTVVDTGITPTEFNFYRFEMVYTTVGSITLSLTGDDGSAFSYTFATIPQMTCQCASGSGNLTLGFARQNGLGQFTATVSANSSGSHPTSNPAFAIGSKVTISSGPQTFYNGTFTLIGTNGTGGQQFALAGATDASSSTSALVKGYPGLIPYFSWGNDTQASPATAQCALDFFSGVWNGGITNTPPNYTSKSRGY